MAMFEADRHNFGRAVEIQERGSELWFWKPRSLFWEHLFFGKESLLKSIFDRSGSNGSDLLSKYLFNLEVEQISSWAGMAKGMQDHEISPTPEHFYGFGVLLAYAYVFGIRDLHRFNLVMTPTHLQVVDVEVVLANLVLPHETILLPFKDIPFSLSGISRLANSFEKIASASKERLMAGFIDLLEAAYDRYDELVGALRSLNLSKDPARVIIRNTVDYRGHLNGDLIEDLLEEEKAQLERGDIPYFCKFVGDNKLQWVAGPDFSLFEVKSMGSFEPDIQRHASSIGNLLPSRDFIKQRLIRGILFLQRRMAVSIDCGPFVFSDRTLEFHDDGMNFTNPGEHYLVAR